MGGGVSGSRRGVGVRVWGGQMFHGQGVGHQGEGGGGGRGDSAWGKVSSRAVGAIIGF